MKKIILTALAGLMLVGCAKNKTLEEAVSDYNSRNGKEEASETLNPVDLSVADGKVGEKIETYFYYFTVNNAYFTQQYGSYEAKKDRKLVVVNVTLENILSKSIAMSALEFQVQWGEGEEEFTSGITYDLDAHSEIDPVKDTQFPNTFSLDANEERTGDLVFEVPQETTTIDFCTMDSFEDASIEAGTYFVTLTPATPE